MPKFERPAKQKGYLLYIEKRLLQYFYTLHLHYNVSDPFTGTTRRVENVSPLGGGGEKHRTDKRGET